MCWMGSYPLQGLGGYRFLFVLCVVGDVGEAVPPTVWTSLGVSPFT